MKIETLTVRYGAKRTHDFQSADAGAEVTISVEPGESVETLAGALHDRLRIIVDEQADGSIRRLADDAAAMRRR